MERREGYEQYGKAAAESFKIGAKVVWTPLKMVVEAEKPVLEAAYARKVADIRRRLSQVKEGYNKSQIWRIRNKVDGGRLSQIPLRKLGS